MSDVTGAEVDVVGPDQWDAIALWLRQHPRGPELLDALAVAAGNLPGEVPEQIAASAGRAPGPGHGCDRWLYRQAGPSRGDSFAADEWTRAANRAEQQAVTTEGTVD
jgi:hypothetical protein